MTKRTSGPDLPGLSPSTTLRGSSQDPAGLPSGWRWARLGDVISEAQSGFASGERDSNGVIQLRMNNVDTRGRLVWNEFIRVPASESVVEKYALRPGDVVFNNTNSTELVGKSAFFDGHAEPVVYSNHFTRLRVAEDQLDSRYLSLWLVEQWQDHVFENLCNRWIGQSAVKSDKLLALEIPLPPLPEQQRIAAIVNEQLAAVERARAAAEAQLQAAKALPAAYLREVFESEEARGWPKVRLGDHVTKIGSGITPLGGQSTYLNSGVPLIRSQNVHMNRFAFEGLAYISSEQDAEMEPSRVLLKDILLNITGASIGRVCVVPSELCPANVNQHVSIIRPDGSFHPEFISFFISTPDFQKSIMDMQSGATRQALTKTLIEDFQIPKPPFETQNRVSLKLIEQMKTVAQTQKVLEAQLAAIEQLPAALLQRAFAGEL
jgi:type I restriction enzyme S subunit